MCGIFAVVNDKNQNAAQTVLNGLKKLEYRGYDSWGIAIKSLGKSKLEVDKHIGKIGNATTDLPNGTIAIGHTRWATHGGVTDTNAHPHLDCTETIAVLHNGIVENYQELKENLKEKGHIFVSETDTEVIAHLIEELVKKHTIEHAVFNAFSKLVGSNAIAVLDLKSESIIACRNGSPLVVGVGEKEFFLASDVPAFLKHTNSVVFLQDNEGVTLSKDNLQLFDLKTQKQKKYVVEKLNWKMEDAEKAGYPHFLLKEIHEQVKTIPKTAQINGDVIAKITDKISDGYKLSMTGCGSASYCTLAAKYFFAKAGIDTQVYGAYEFSPFQVFCDAKTIVAVVSQSGETADTLIAVKQAKKNKACIVSVINSNGSTLERLSDYTLSVGAGPEIAVISTKAFTSQLATLYLLAQTVQGNGGKARNTIIELGKILTAWLNEKTQSSIMDCAKLIMNHEDMYVIGKHINYPAALEFALKIKETSYIHSEAFASGELKHGVITLIQKGTPCFALSANDEIKYELLSSATELKSRGGYIIGIAPYPAKEFDYWIQTPNIDPELSIFPNVIVGQLLGYYLGVGRGTDPDKPRNLAKSVTVK